MHSFILFLLLATPLNDSFFNDLAQSSVTIKALYNNEMMGPTVGSGSGTLIKKDDKIFILTVAHVIDNALEVACLQDLSKTPSFEIKPYVGECRVLIIDKKNELALLQLMDNKYKSKIPAFKLAKSNPKIGTKVFICSSPYGESGHDIITTGIISRYSSFDKLNTLDVTALVAEGSSGGIMVDESKDIVGIVVGVSARPLVSIVLPVSTVKTFCENHKINWLFNDEKRMSDYDLDELNHEYIINEHFQ